MITSGLLYAIYFSTLLQIEKMIKIDFLGSVESSISIVSNWLYQEWGVHNPHSSLEKTIASIHLRAGSKTVPFTLVASIGTQIVGTASVVENDLAHFPQYKPWLASVYVEPGFRNQGIASELCKYADQGLRELGFSEYYLFTYSTEKYYLARGWKNIGTSENRGQPVTLMQKRL